MNIVVSLVLELLFLRQKMKDFLLGYCGDPAPCQWGRVAVVVWAGDGCNLSGWGGLTLWYPALKYYSRAKGESDLTEI